MDTFKIKIITEIAKQKNISKVAEEFSYTPSAFSHMISSFEEELGVKIFSRSSVGVTLTSEGEKLVTEFKKILKAETEVYNLVSSFEERKVHELNVATYSSVLRNLLFDVIKKFRTEHPTIKVNVSVVDNLDGWLENDRADVVFGDKEYFGDYLSGLLYNDEYHVVGTPKLLNGVKTIERKDFYNYPIIDTGESVWMENFSLENFKERIYFKSEDDMSIFKMVKEGFGVTLLPKTLLTSKRGLQTAKLEPPIKREIFYSYKKANQNSFALKKFIKILQKQA